MSAELFVESTVPAMSWERFTSRYPVGSIALDGFVEGGPHFNPDGPYLNANHHVGVARLATLSTAQQILMYARMGLTDTFQEGGEFTAKVFANDCDEDVCTAWYLLDRINTATRSRNPRLDRFIAVAGTLDVTAGAYPYDPRLPILGKIAWVFEPYRQFRASKEMARKDDRQYTEVIQRVAGRIASHLAGKGASIAPDIRYRIVGGGDSWKMIEEIGAEGRIGAFYDGINAYVIVQEEVAGVRWRYTIGKRSDFIPFDVTGILQRLNVVERCAEDRWGGGSTIGGSPRVSGSKLSPDQVGEVIREHIARPERTYIT